MLLHFSGKSSVVHEDIRSLQVGDGTEHVVVELTAGDVIHDVGTRFDGATGGKAVTGVDREERFGKFAVQQGDCVDKSLCFYLGRQELRSGTRGSGTNVDDVSSFVEESSRMFEHAVGGIVSAAIVERVGGDVKYAHDDGALESDQTSADGDSKWSIVHDLHNVGTQSILCRNNFYILYNKKERFAF